MLRGDKVVCFAEVVGDSEVRVFSPRALARVCVCVCVLYTGLMTLQILVRDDHESKKLNVHLYNSIKKSLYKPAAFSKGFLFPLAEVCVVVSRIVPVSSTIIDGQSCRAVAFPERSSLRSSALPCRCATPPVRDGHTGPTSVFIQVLIDKEYALSYPTKSSTDSSPPSCGSRASKTNCQCCGTRACSHSPSGIGMTSPKTSETRCSTAVG